MFARRVKYWSLRLWQVSRGFFSQQSRPRESIGDFGERIAKSHLKKKGMRIIETGFRERFGEIDIIAVHNRVVVFVEVKTRQSDIAGKPETAVDEDKQRKIIRIAIAFLKRHNLSTNPCRFDVVAITGDQSTKNPQIVHFESAFRLEDSDAHRK